MSKPIYITRRETLHAIRTEPLKAGKWASNEEGNEGKCSVCAVGAVLRKAGLDDACINQFGNRMIINFKNVTALSVYSKKDENEKIEEHLDNDRFLQALSLKFECQAKRTGAGKRTRTILADFIKANFPKKIELSYEQTS